MSSDVAKTVFQASSTFCNNLHAELTKAKGNILFSPISAHVILSLLYQGTAGEATKCLEKALKLRNAKDVAETYKTLMQELKSVPNVSLYLANKIFVDKRYTLVEEFKSISESCFLADAENVNFSKSTEAATSINNWVKSKTNKKITEIIDPEDLSDATPLVLVNAIYFKGDWLYKFKRSETTKEKFYITETEAIDCDMMHKKKDCLYYRDFQLDAQIVQLKYKTETVSMLIILPGSKMGIDDLEKKFDVNNLSNYMIEMETELVELSLPRFKIETKMDLRLALSELGLGQMFSGGVAFTEMLNTSEKLTVGKIVQKTFIEVNEEGTESTGTTAAVCLFMTEAEPYPVFNADHPFMFCLVYQHEENIIPLFIGTFRGV